MDIHSEEYKIASLNENEGTLKAIEDAETKIAELTGKDITLIAYEKDQNQGKNQ
ncbi:hypothetical protein [Paenibacillus sp. ISL-20]|uniref:hypothetical protein n=1 Tax=Paenibacillus sp. ISL-20 TaxID=2819163 RepID=UPI001BE6C332|nr:hypothetical protein [Paenibacillus sp. ISL-20]MBT2765746.1 hypothetical protein [Paenibacillus sp. ISL-20]